jgi:hypothetical protein
MDEHRSYIECIHRSYIDHTLEIQIIVPHIQIQIIVPHIQIQIIVPHIQIQGIVPHIQINGPHIQVQINGPRIQIQINRPHISQIIPKQVAPVARAVPEGVQHGRSIRASN